ncbi:cAMP-regulated phosphoprotein/endosulfine conserved region containing protein [Leishmania donovani]|uniref:cAMP-regulated_phosphoprotein/endosulfine_conserv ed_region_containing_protein_putative/Pfam:PF04667 n=1 Tax=Leishmania donovani TaxID=5661 RepID=A0A6J8FJB9_LEIDO|nr:cAMP-regulated phosphoprotein/endosulfine conserved region containing protein [Leishmania donovani]VDZ47582.1 cAMP-regulated_phosphoprotein/endosulfine_conserved_region_containing_protein_putative/Pfam:PF04667 [Leishmania donovani]
MADQAPPGVNMPKKRDPRLRQMQAPQQQKFFDSADYEVRKQQQQQPSQQQPSQQQQPSHGQMAPNGIPRRGPADGLHLGAADGGAPRGKNPPPPPLPDGYAVPGARRTPC